MVEEGNYQLQCFLNCASGDTETICSLLVSGCVKVLGRVVARAFVSCVVRAKLVEYTVSNF